jgi:predicted phosphoribosyltransferase
MGKVIADELGGELDVALVRKIGAPGNPQYAIGSVAENGEIAVREDARVLGIPQSWIDDEARRQLAVLRERRRTYTPGRPPADPAGRVAIVLDDGVATGSTILAALKVVRAERPARLVAVTAVAPASTVKRLAAEADEVVVLATPEPFYAVGRFFDDFGEVTDAEVIAALAESGDRVAAAD